ncbi:MAG TPA: DUF5050 domain-containing protein [Clostridiales bacterium]|jgi:hypothetical protein|nr:DUF5050 domain-containing protein [Clostridiales bacterium]
MRKSFFPYILGIIAVLGGFYLVSTLLSPTGQEPLRLAASSDAVWFSHPLDDQKLYRMGPDGSNIEKALDQAISCLWADGSNVYYTDVSDPAEARLFRFDPFSKSGQEVLRLDGRKPLTVIDSRLLYQDPAAPDITYSINFDGSDRKTAYYGFVRQAVAEDGLIYFITDKRRSGPRRLLQRAEWKDGQIVGAQYPYPLTTNTYTVIDGILYFQADQALMMIPPDSQDHRTLKGGRKFSAIAGNSQYLFYSTSGATNRLFRFDLSNRTETLLIQ